MLLAGLLVGLPDALRAQPNVPSPEETSFNAEPAEHNYAVTFYRKKDGGLPDNTVNALLQARNGYLWVGTGAGLVRFDGLTFTESSFRDVPITALLEDREGGLWIGTQGRGVIRLYRDHSEAFGVARGLADTNVTSLTEDAAGTVWIGTLRGLNKWENGQLKLFNSPTVRPGDGIVALSTGHSGTLWITTRSGVYSLRAGKVEPFPTAELPQGRNAELIGAYEDRAGNLWAFGATFLLNLTQGRRLNSPAMELASSRVWTICEQRDGAFWIGSGRGLFRFQNRRFEITGAREGLSQCDVRALYADRWGNLWIGTNGKGLARLRLRRLQSIGLTEEFTSRKPSALAPNPAGGFWVGTADSGLWHWDLHGVEPFAGGPPLDRVTQIQSLCVDRRGELWVGTWGEGLFEVGGAHQRRFTTADGLSDNVICSVAADVSSDAVWAGTLAGNLHRLRGEQIDTFTSANGLTGSAILCLLAEARGGMLIGSESGGLVHWDGTRFASLSAPREVTRYPVRSLYVDRKNRLWVGTWGTGAFCRQGENWLHLTARQGLGSDFIGQIAEDDEGALWFGTDQSLFKVSAADMENWLQGGRESISCLPGLADEGLDDRRCPMGWPGVARDTNGVVWLATGAGLLPLSSRDSAVAEPPPPVLLERVLVNGQPVSLTEGSPLQLGPAAASLDFFFTAISFSAPDKVRFRHKLENFDADWVQNREARFAHYGPLPPGRYQFHVRAGNASGGWNETGASLAVWVAPPVWRAWWFVTLSAFVIVAGVWALARFISTRRLQARLRAAEQQHATDRERARIAQDMHDEIGSKLTRISFLSEIARHAGAESPAVAPPVEAIASTSRELLQALDEIVWAVNPRNDTLEQLAGYLEQHAREYFQGTSVECEIHVPAQLPRASLTAELRHNVFLAFEEALNNSLKHAHASRVQVTMSLAPGTFEVRVQDNGKGFALVPNALPGQDGLRNMRDRLRAIGGECELDSRPGGGVAVTLRFPLAETSAPVAL